jgi:hypothetical protein
LGDSQDLELGRKLEISNFKNREIGKYFVRNGNFLSIIEIGKEAKYLLNRVEL